MRISDWSSDVCSSDLSRLGAALDTAIRYQLPIHYVSNGQKVPENLLLPNAAELVDQALAHNQQASALYAPTEADFAALMSLTKVPEDTSQAAAAESRRKRLLPGLLSMAGGPGSGLTMDDLHAASAYIDDRSEEHKSELQSLISNTYAVSC